MQRREFLQAAIGGGLATGFMPALHANAVATPVVDLIAAPAQAMLRAGQAQATRVLAYNGSVPGPVLRLPRGRETRIRLRNALDAPTTVHWHGLRIDNAMDGVPGMTQDPVPPGGEFEYRLNPPDAGTYWYHTHLRSWEQLALGLAGVLIVDEDEPPLVDQDLVLAFDDWRLDDAMQVDTRSLGSLHDWSHGGRLGNFMTINGVSQPRYSVARGERLRLRLVNIANARTMRLLPNLAGFVVVAVDGQPVEPFEPTGGEVRLAPGQRVDLMGDLDLAPGQASPVEIIVGEYAYEIAHFEALPAVRRERPLDEPPRLPPNPVAEFGPDLEFRRIPLLMQGGAMGGLREAEYQGQVLGLRELAQKGKVWAFNGVVGMPAEPLFRVPRGSAISLEIENDNAWPHAMHVHGHHFQRDSEPGLWRDTTLFERGERGTIRFIADNPGQWLIHCHMAEHMAAGMETWFEVT